MNVPRDLRYTSTHEWIRIRGTMAVVGITDFAEHTDEDLGTALQAMTKAGMKRLVLDLLKIEKRPDAWSGVLDTAITDIDELVQAGQLSLAAQLLEAIAAVAGDEASPFVEPARAAMTRLVEGPLVRHLARYLRQATDVEFGIAQRMCTIIGPVLVKPMSDAIMGEENPKTVRRLRDILISFGAAAREYANELRSSRNPAVRRAAVDLLRALGGDAALPDLRTMLDDTDPQVQREALRAIVQIGTDDAYKVLEQALKSGARGPATPSSSRWRPSATRRRPGCSSTSWATRRTPARWRPPTRRPSSRSAGWRTTIARSRR